jgi:hypothetical protein
VIADWFGSARKTTGNIGETRLFFAQDLAQDGATGFGTKNPQRDGPNITSGTGKLQAIIHD